MYVLLLTQVQQRVENLKSMAGVTFGLEAVLSLLLLLDVLLAPSQEEVYAAQ